MSILKENPRCPECGAVLDAVVVVATCAQMGYVEGGIVVRYGDTEIDDTIGVECPECECSVEHLVREEGDED